MNKRRPRVVPGLVLSATFIGVVPACALEACGGTVTTSDGGAGDAAPDQFTGVGAVAYCCFDGGVADVGFVNDASDGGGPSDADGAGDASDDGG